MPQPADAPPRMTKARTKIVCTIGPASAGRDVLRSLIDAGLDVARINFSHGTYEELSRPVAILGDLQGPRIRIGDLSTPRTVADGAELSFAHEPHAVAGDVPVTYDSLAQDVKVGGRILVDDGLLEFEVISVSGHRVTVRTIHGGPIKSHKGMNLPGIDVSAPSLTEKDRADIGFAIEHDLDYLALSFVRRADDVRALKALLPKRSEE